MRDAYLRKQVEWCVDMAARALTPGLVENYVALAAACERQAAELERRSTSRTV